MNLYIFKSYCILYLLYVLWNNKIIKKYILQDNENLDMSLTILNWFHMKSGLPINFSKAKFIKVIRIGSIEETERRFGKENDMDSPWHTI